jgi:hypothetical protein
MATPKKRFLFYHVEMFAVGRAGLRFRCKLHLCSDDTTLEEAMEDAGETVPEMDANGMTPIYGADFVE